MNLPSTLIVMGLLLASGCSMKYTYPHEQGGEPMTELEALSVAGTDQGLICERTPVVGTRLAKRVCSTRAQREARAEQARRGLEEVQRKATQPSIQE